MTVQQVAKWESMGKPVYWQGNLCYIQGYFIKVAQGKVLLSSAPTGPRNNIGIVNIDIIAAPIEELTIPEYAYSD